MVVAPAVLVDVGPVPPVVAGGAGDGEQAATKSVRTRVIVARRRWSSGFGARLPGGRNHAIRSIGGCGSGGITGGWSQMWTGMPRYSWESSQSESQVFTRVQPCEAGYAGTS